LTFAVPGVMPAAYAANANLFVSAENSQFDNYMSGPQVIEVVIIDSDINDTDELKGEPDVTVNGKILRMVQAVDGNWYGYFADRDQAQIADSTATNVGDGLDFGNFCSASSGTAAIGFSTSETDGIVLPITITNTTSGANGTQTGSSTGGAITVACDATTSGNSEGNGTNNVVREAKDPNDNVSRGQIGLLDGAGVWPFIQLYELNPTGNVVIQYNKGGGVQSTTLTFDTVDQYADLSLDRAIYPRSAQIHATITDLWLNIDPTDEDSWTFATNTANTTTGAGVGTYYQVFDENGALGGTDNTATNLSDTLSDLMCEDNCVLTLNLDAQTSGTPVVTIQDNDDSILTNINATVSTNDAGVNNATAFGVQSETGLLSQGTVPVTITEQGPNSGVFGTYDESDVSVLKITSDAKRGTSASLDYNETPQTILVGFDFASIDIQPIDDEWSSGEEIPVVVVDDDQNKNSRADEDLDLNNPDVTLIPALTTGNPFTFGDAGSSIEVIFTNGTDDTDSVFTAQSVAAPIGNFTFTINTTGLTGATNTTTTESVDTYSDRLVLSGLTATLQIITLVM